MDDSTPATPPAVATGHAAPATEPAKRPGVWAGLGTVVLYFALQFALSILVGIGIAVAYALKLGITDGLRHQRPDVHAMVATLRGNPDVKVVLAVVTIAGAAALMALLVRRLWPAQWSVPAPPGFGLVKPREAWWYVVAVTLAVALLIVGGVLTQLLAHGQPVQQDVGVLFNRATPALRILMLVMVVAAAPFVEELVFRGVLLSGLMRRMPAGAAVAVSALVFGCAHLPDFGFVWYPVPALVLLGLALAWLRLRSRSLWPSITLHATNNCLAVVAWLLALH